MMLDLSRPLFPTLHQFVQRRQFRMFVSGLVLEEWLSWRNRFAASLRRAPARAGDRTGRVGRTASRPPRSGAAGRELREHVPVRQAIDRLGDYTDFRARKVLKILNLEPQKDVFLLQIGGQTARFAALRSGQVQSVFVAPPLTLVAKRAGFRILVELADLGFEAIEAHEHEPDEPAPLSVAARSSSS